VHVRLPQPDQERQQRDRASGGEEPGRPAAPGDRREKNVDGQEVSEEDVELRPVVHVAGDVEGEEQRQQCRGDGRAASEA